MSLLVRRDEWSKQKAGCVRKGENMSFQASFACLLTLSVSSTRIFSRIKDCWIWKTWARLGKVRWFFFPLSSFILICHQDASRSWRFFLFHKGNNRFSLGACEPTRDWNLMEEKVWWSRKKKKPRKSKRRDEITNNKFSLFLYFFFTQEAERREK